MAAKKRSLWFGYLEAGVKGSLVVRDPSMDTGMTSTIYLFNFAKGRIVEYRRDIVEPKLRELTESEGEGIAEIRKAFKKARDGFTPRVTLRPPRRRPEPQPETPDFELDDDLPPPDDDQAEDSDHVSLG
jgi:hypothetical protein